MLRCTHYHEQGVDLATIEGRFIQQDGAETRNALLYLVARGSGKLVLNLASATYMDAFGLASLVLVSKAMQHRNGRVVLCAIPRNLEALIEMTRIQGLFEIFACVNTAVATLSAVPSDDLSTTPATMPRLPGEDLTLRGEREQRSDQELRRGTEDAGQRFAPFNAQHPRTDKAPNDPMSRATAAA